MELVGPWILTKNDYKRRRLSENLRLGKNAGAVPRLRHASMPRPLEAANLVKPQTIQASPYNLRCGSI